MALNFGTGVSRTLDPARSAMVQVVIQKGKPVLDADHNLAQQISADWARSIMLRGCPSGWIGDGVNPSDSFETSSSWSNWFKFGRQRSGEKGSIEWAHVNGWLLPVMGTLTGTPPGSPDDVSTWNRITLDPPPGNSGDSRIDFVFLEAWQALIAPNPSTTNKPASSGIYRYGNVEGGASFITDDLKDPTLNFEVSRRVQVQYRLRVVSGLLGLATYPHGFDPTLVKAQGAASSVTSYTFTNMGKELGDPGLWRAGDGTANGLGTVDGYTYAIPLAVVFRRNTVSWDGDPGQNLNGALNRNPTATDRTGYRTFSVTPTLNASLSASASSLTLVSASNIPLATAPAVPIPIQVNDEIMLYSAISGTTVTISQRAAYGTKAKAHASGSTVTPLSGAPDGLFSDQVAKTDILDLRHIINPNGFDYDTLLRNNLDKLLKGELRSNWKRSGGGPQGTFVRFQDKISNSPAATGVTKLDGPDNIRLIFSDAIVQQPVDLIVETASAGNGSTWSLSLTCTSVQASANQFSSGDTITIPVTQFKTGLPGGDVDQVRFLSSGDGTAPVEIRVDGSEQPLPTSAFTVTPANPAPTDDLVITLAAGFPAATTRKLWVRFHVVYGSGRGLSRRPDSIASIATIGSSADMMTQLAGIPADNVPLRTSWLPLWSRYRTDMFRNMLPVTAEAYADPGSKSIVLTPFRRIALPTKTWALDGSYANPNTGVTVSSGSTATTAGTTTFSQSGATFAADGVVVGDALLITSPLSIAGRYTVTGGIGATSFTVDRTIVTQSGVVYTIHHTQGLMPLNDVEGVAKWTTTDPLGLFSGTTEGTVATKNLYIQLPRNLMPGWGEVRVPIIHSDATTTPSGGSATFDEGVNFGVLTQKGDRSSGPESETNYVGFNNGGISYAPMSTMNLTTEVAATYNSTFTYSGNTFAGLRFFTDTRGLGRTGLELPPFYGIARLFGVYEADDYATNGSGYHPTTRVPTGSGATNLLRQNMSSATFWIETDEDGDSTFILNSEAIDLSKSPTLISSFAAGNYVLEASLFGFDRNSFSGSQPCRLVLHRGRDSAEAKNGTRSNNFGTGANAEIFAPELCVPGPFTSSDEVVVNYSRTPYQGDAWGSQTTYFDIGHKQGPLLTGTAYQIAGSTLDQENLTRPNPKIVEVLSSLCFSTTAGTGRLSADPASSGFTVKNVGYEVMNGFYPPETSLDARPELAIGALTVSESTLVIGTQYGGSTERLPLGALFRDKDFRGGFTGGQASGDFQRQVDSCITFSQAHPGMLASGLTGAVQLDQTEVDVNTSHSASGQPGEVLVHVDGEQGNYSLTTNFRTNRGGSLFVGGGARPGGELAASLMGAGPHPSSANVLNGVAMLVRNIPTSIGSSQVSAGGELMLLVATTVDMLGTSGRQPQNVVIGTNGSGEGYSAADLMRIEGHCLELERGEIVLDSSTITLSPPLAASEL